MDSISNARWRRQRVEVDRPASESGAAADAGFAGRERCRRCGLTETGRIRVARRREFRSIDND